MQESPYNKTDLFCSCRDTVPLFPFQDQPTFDSTISPLTGLLHLSTLWSSHPTAFYAHLLLYTAVYPPVHLQRHCSPKRSSPRCSPCLTRGPT